MPLAATFPHHISGYCCVAKTAGVPDKLTLVCCRSETPTTSSSLMVMVMMVVVFGGKGWGNNRPGHCEDPNTKQRE